MSETNEQQGEHCVSGSALSGLVMRVIATGDHQKLSDEETRRFHRDFANEIGPVIAEHRKRQRMISSATHSAKS